MIVILSFFVAFWFHYELHRFYYRLNQQMYRDFIQLQPSTIHFEVFLQRSSIQPLTSSVKYLFFWICPFSSLCLIQHSPPLQWIMLLLLYLSVLDYHYSLTDSRYIGLIFWLSILYALFFSGGEITSHMLNWLITTAFFISFAWISRLIYRQEVFGLGDVLLFIALAPLFNLTQMILLIFIASLAGLIFAFGYFCKFKCKIDRLPFIPFISFSTFLLFIVKLPF